ncbi:hypothetical protein MBLNU230_g7721t1 [Neophaeotheca triangularis]
MPSHASYEDRRSSENAAIMPAKLKNLMQNQKPSVSIELRSNKNVYTTMDQLDGHVSITSPVDCYFDQIEIEFIGTSRTFVERLSTASAVSGRSEAFHQFLKLSQPNLQFHYPENMLLKAGKTYTFPFIFAVPEQMLLKICKHSVKSPAVRDAHLQLPPSLGDKELIESQELQDDMAPDMASVRYGIFAKLIRNKPSDEGNIKTNIATKAKRVRVIPATAEQPPVNVDGPDNDYVMRKEKSVKKGLLKNKLGRITMEAQQPKSFTLPVPRSSSEATSEGDDQVTTLATIMLRFDPADEFSKPPKLGALASKLKVTTFYASSTRKDFPSKAAPLMDTTQGIHTETLSLSSRYMAAAEWCKHDAADDEVDTAERRDSATSMTSKCSTGFTPSPSEAYKGKTYYTARLLVPITLPSHKTFVPTFHTCLISRIYCISLSLNIPNAGMKNIDLKVPVQISAAHPASLSRRSSIVSLPNENQLDHEEEADVFEARRFSPPSPDFIGRSNIGQQQTVPLPADGEAPPGYSFFAPSGHLGGQSVPVY